MEHSDIDYEVAPGDIVVQPAVRSRYRRVRWARVAIVVAIVALIVVVAVVVPVAVTQSQKANAASTSTRDAKNKAMKKVAEDLAKVGKWEEREAKKVVKKAKAGVTKLEEGVRTELGAKDRRWDALPGDGGKKWRKEGFGNSLEDKLRRRRDRDARRRRRRKRQRRERNRKKKKEEKKKEKKEEKKKQTDPKSIQKKEERRLKKEAKVWTPAKKEIVKKKDFKKKESDSILKLLMGEKEEKKAKSVDVTKDKMEKIVKRITTGTTVTVTTTPTKKKPVMCPADVKRCADGSFVARDSTNGCRFRKCPRSRDPRRDPREDPVIRGLHAQMRQEARELRARHIAEANSLLRNHRRRISLYKEHLRRSRRGQVDRPRRPGARRPGARRDHPSRRYPRRQRRRPRKSRSVDERERRWRRETMKQRRQIMRELASGSSRWRERPTV